MKSLIGKLTVSFKSIAVSGAFSGIKKGISHFAELVDLFQQFSFGKVQLNIKYCCAPFSCIECKSVFMQKNKIRL